MICQEFFLLTHKNLDIGSEYRYNESTRLWVEILGGKHYVDCVNNQCSAFLFAITSKLHQLLSISVIQLIVGRIIRNAAS